MLIIIDYHQVTFPGVNVSNMSQLYVQKKKDINFEISRTNGLYSRMNNKATQVKHSWNNNNSKNNN